MAVVKRIPNEHHALMRELIERELLALNVSNISFGEDDIWPGAGYRFPSEAR